MTTESSLENSQICRNWPQTLKLPIGREVTKEIRKCLEMNEDEDITHPSVQDAAHAVLGGKFIAVNTYLKSGGITSQ